MLEKQRTIEKLISIEGTGLHTGAKTKMTFKPAPDNYGIKFIRVDLGDKPEIPATADYVIDVSRGTTIGIGEAKVHTIEHVLAAIVGLQIDNIAVEIDGIEPPVGDGSAMPYVEKLQEAGFIIQKENKDYLIIDETINYHNEEEQVDEEENDQQNQENEQENIEEENNQQNQENEQEQENLEEENLPEE